MILRVDESVRRRNSRAIQERANWRRRYATMVGLIKDCKREIRRNPQGAAEKMKLTSLRILANHLMIERDLIRMDLQDSAYPYAE
jgi:hypothetical protein